MSTTEKSVFVSEQSDSKQNLGGVVWLFNSSETKSDFTVVLTACLLEMMRAYQALELRYRVQRGTAAASWQPHPQCLAGSHHLQHVCGDDKGEVALGVRQSNFKQHRGRLLFVCTTARRPKASSPLSSPHTC